MRPPGLGEFPVTSLSETELFKKFAVPQAENSIQGPNLSLRDIQTFSGVNLDLSGIIRSLDFLLLFGQAKSRRKIKNVELFYSHYRILRCTGGVGTRNDGALRSLYWDGVSGGFAATNPIPTNTT
jgi:hypothetical protein